MTRLSKKLLQIAEKHKSGVLGNDDYLYLINAATMLRQKQSRIRRLEAKIEAYKDWMCSVHSFIDSTCPNGFVGEAFRAVPNSILIKEAVGNEK